MDLSEAEKKEISKYRNLINQIKNDNKVIQKEITSLYRQKKISIFCDIQIKMSPKLNQSKKYLKQMIVKNKQEKSCWVHNQDNITKFMSV